MHVSGIKSLISTQWFSGLACPAQAIGLHLSMPLWGIATDGMASVEPDTDGSDDVTLDERAGNQNTALVDGRDPRPATAPTNKRTTN
jgi:hypothetical protein